MNSAGSRTAAWEAVWSTACMRYPLTMKCDKGNEAPKLSFTQLKILKTPDEAVGPPRLTSLRNDPNTKGIVDDGSRDRSKHQRCHLFSVDTTEDNLGTGSLDAALVASS